MNLSLILSHIQQHISLTEVEKQIFLTCLQEEDHRKGTFVLRQDESCSHIYFINSGILRAFYTTPEGKESTIMFGLKGWWITDMYCFLNEHSAMVSIQVVQDCNVLKLSKTNLDALYQQIPQFNKFFRVLMQNAYCREQLRMIQNLSLPAKERYEQFIQRYPQIAANITLKQIASYLGITPEFLSTVRSKKS